MTGAEPAAAPFVETPAGERFFLNAVLTAPALIVLWPVLLRGVLRALGVLDGPSALLDPVPLLAERAGPYVAWLSVIPLWSCRRNLRMEMPSPARWTLWGFAAIHAGVIAWWLSAVTL